jgi:hypothetical protein
MLKKVETKCKRCKNEFCKKRTEQEFCSAQCRNAAWKKSRKDASRVPVAPREESGSPVTGITQRLSIMIVSGGSTQRAEALRRPIIVVGRNDPVRDVDLPSNALGDGVLGPRLGTLPSLVTT